MNPYWPNFLHVTNLGVMSMRMDNICELSIVHSQI